MVLMLFKITEDGVGFVIIGEKKFEGKDGLIFNIVKR